MDSFPLKLEEFPAHLGRGATAKVLPRFDGTMEALMSDEALLRTHLSV